MNDWWYASGENKIEATRDELLKLSKEGIITPDTLVWNDELTDWIPFRDSGLGSPGEDFVRCSFSGKERPRSEMLPYGDSWVLPEHREEFAQSLQEGTSDPDGELSWNEYVYMNPTKREKMAKGGMIFAAVVSILWIVGCAIYGAYLGAQNELEKLNEENLTYMGLAITLPATWTGMVLYMMWVHRVVRNAHVLAKTTLDQTPGWAVGFHFIPIVSLWKPFVAIKETWNASHGLPLTEGNKLLGWWWACWLLNSFLSGLLPFIGLPAALASIILAWIFITRITAKQQELASVQMAQRRFQ